MTQRNNILQELNEIGSTLLNVTPQNIYQIPDGYFEGLAEQVLNRIKAIEVTNAKDELRYLSPVVHSIPKEIPYSVPAGYFNGLEERLMNIVRESEDYQTAKEELESISPLLSGLNKKMPYSVPQGYFETLTAEINTKPETKIVSITHRKWFRYAAAAVVVGIVAMGAFFYINRKTISPVDENKAWAKIEKKVETLSDKEIKDFVESTDAGLNANETADLQPVKKEEIKDLLKDVSDNDLKKFLEQTSDGGDDILSLN